MSPVAIVNTAAVEDFGLIAITDHNEIINVEAAIKASVGTAVSVVPGVELSTPEGHLLVYFDEYVRLADFVGKLALAGKGGPESRCQTSLLDCLHKIDPSHGFAVLAHVDSDGGFERKVQGYPHTRGVFSAILLFWALSCDLLLQIFLILTQTQSPSAFSMARSG
jgi:hypothetical protein